MLPKDSASRPNGICKTGADDSPVDDEIFTGRPDKTDDADEADSDPATLPDESKALIRDVLRTLPIEHKRSQVVLRGIFRNKKWWYYPAHYRPRARVIEISHPLKLGRLYRSLSTGTADGMFCQLESTMAGDTSKWPEGRSKTDSSFFFRNVEARRGGEYNFYQYAFLHEFGHSLDHMVNFTGQFVTQAPLGAWIQYQFGQLDRLIYDMLQEANAPDLANLWTSHYRPIFAPALEVLEAAEHAAGRPRHYCKSWREARRLNVRTARIPGLSATAIRTAIDGRLDAAAQPVPFPDQHRARFTTTVLLVFATLDVAIGDPHLQSVGHGQADPLNRLGVRRFQFMSMYGRWTSYLDAAFQRRISNYQFSAPGEWFPEAYSALFGPPPRQRAFRAADPEGMDWLLSCLCTPDFNHAVRGRGLLRRAAGKFELAAVAPIPDGSISTAMPAAAHALPAAVAAAPVTPVWDDKWKRDVLDHLEPGDIILAYGFNMVAFGQGVAKFFKRVTVVPWLLGTGLRAAAGGGTLGNAGTVNANHAMIVLGPVDEYDIDKTLEYSAKHKRRIYVEAETAASIARHGARKFCENLAHATNRGVHKSPIVDVFKGNYDTLRVFRRKALPDRVSYAPMARVRTHVHDPGGVRVDPTFEARARDVSIPVGAAMTASAWSYDSVPQERLNSHWYKPRAWEDEQLQYMEYAAAKAVRSGFSLSAFISGGSAEAYHKYKLETGGPPSTSFFTWGSPVRKKRMFCSMFVIACYHAAGRNKDERKKYLPLDASATSPEMLDTYLRNSGDWDLVLTANATAVEEAPRAG
jgi:hypothetical protein